MSLGAVLKHKNPLYSVAKWGDRVWVGAGKDGPFSLQGAALVLEKNNILDPEHVVRGRGRPGASRIAMGA